jgi:DNA-binding beta-propeller fold protein YncE
MFHSSAMQRFLSILVCWVFLLEPTVFAQENGKSVASIPFEGQADAPDFPAGMEWLNTSHPFSLNDFRGKVVLLDFWTYCCINCMHIIPDLKKLEAKYPKELVVVGVHSAKFQNEKDTENIREAIKRYEIGHPVVNDRDFQIWRSYSIHSWPSLMLINPNGRIIGRHSGEGIYDLFDEVIGETIRHFDAKGEIKREPIRFDLEKSFQAPSLLSYPGKVAADPKSSRLVVSDSNHNRIIVSDFSGLILEVVGDGTPGLKDGDFSEARFFRPQGVFLDSGAGLIYVADTENHAIRTIDLKRRTVKTLVGTGEQGRRGETDGKQRLNSPWDIVLVNGNLYVAMAGPHQLWRLDPSAGLAAVFAGSGRENLTDGPLTAAALAQPSGITSDGKSLYFADSEVSSVRAASLDLNGGVKTLIGKGLFDFGDVDGDYPDARLQHPLGVLYADGILYVADTYNHKIKKLDPNTRHLTSFLGTGKRGYTDGPGATAQFNEPSGLALADGKLFIADANNHLVRVCDLTNNTVRTISWTGLEKLQSSPELVREGPTLRPEQAISAKAKSLEFSVRLPAGKKLNPVGKSVLQLKSEGTVRLTRSEIAVDRENVTIPLEVQAGKGSIEVQISLFYCDKANSGLCFFKEEHFKVPLSVGESGPEKFVLNYAPDASRAAP